MRALDRLHYGWIVVAVTFLVLLTGAGVRATPGVLIRPLEHAFGWSNATISSAVAINILLYGLLGPFAVAVMERFGLRRTVCGALLLLTLGVALTTAMNAPWQLMLLWGVLVGTGTGMIALVLGATIAGRWFLKHRGLVLGILTASSATGQLAFLPFLAALDEHFGWRAVAAAVATATLALVPLVALLLRDRPSDMDLAPYGGSTIETRPALAQNPATRAIEALRDAAKRRDFWLLCGSFFICGAAPVEICTRQGLPAFMPGGSRSLAELEISEYKK